MEIATAFQSSDELNEFAIMIDIEGPSNPSQLLDKFKRISIWGESKTITNYWKTADNWNWNFRFSNIIITLSLVRTLLI